jgi:hypothetical protein
MRRSSAIVLTCLLSITCANATSDAATLKACGKVADPYPNTRYDGVDLTKVTARGVSCATAKRVARGGHAKALGLTPSQDGIRRFSWDGWKVVGDLSGVSDRYVATRHGARVTWRF